MTSFVLRLLHVSSAGLVLVYSARRFVFLIAPSRPRGAVSTPELPLPSLAIVVACRNEAPGVGRLLEELEGVEYPAEALSIVLVDDGSADGTGELLARWAAGGSGRSVVRLPVSGGKVRALEAGAAAAPWSELVAVCDADQRPRPDCWRLLARSFADERVGAAAGFLHPANHDADLVSRYAALEAWVHQLVTSEGKDRLGLNPPTLGGASVYRRSALADVGGFAAGISGEDVTTSIALTEAGWTTRFVREALVENQVVEGWEDYWEQHVRWARGLFDTTREHRRRSRATSGRRVEGWLVSAGYLDRLGFLGTCVPAAAHGRGRWLPALYAGVAGLEVCVALARAGVRAARAPWYATSLVVVFPVDIAATGLAVVSHLRRRQHTWRSPRRADTGQPSRGPDARRP